MRIIKTIHEWQIWRSQCEQKTLGFVATMGNLHQGHASLLKRSGEENQLTVLSIFVNPAQFNDPNDLQNYPRTFQADCELAERLNVNVVFAPDPEALYPDDYRYRVSEEQLAAIYEGQYRPGHLTGVLTVVLKLLMLIKPTHAYFGEKDYQQLQLIKGMAQAFFLATEIVACETMRDENGLALSSRNTLLSPAEREHASVFSKLLTSTKTPTEISAELIAAGFKVDYIADHDGYRLGAVHLNTVRLIDTVKQELPCKSKP